MFCFERRYTTNGILAWERKKLVEKKERKKMRMSGRNGFQRSRTDKEKDSSRK